MIVQNVRSMISFADMDADSQNPKSNKTKSEINIEGIHMYMF